MKERNGKLVYVCGSGHSGSTLLSLLLGNQARMVSLGEIYQTVRNVALRQKPCTCGAAAQDCPVWGDILDAVSSLPEEERLAPTMNMLAGRCDPAVMIDSSKHLKILKQHVGRRDLDVFAVHLVRDGRAVAFSNARKDRDMAEAARTWQKVNLDIADYLAKSLPGRHVTIRYEDLVARPVDTIRRICDGAGLAVDAVGLDWKDTTHHHLRGNKMRFAEEAAIRPDATYIDGLTQRDWDSVTRLIGAALSAFSYQRTKDGMRSILQAGMTAT